MPQGPGTAKYYVIKAPMPVACHGRVALMEVLQKFTMGIARNPGAVRARRGLFDKTGGR